MSKILAALLLGFTLISSSVVQADGSCTDLFSFSKTTEKLAVSDTVESKIKEEKVTQNIEFVEKDLTANTKEEVVARVRELLFFANQTANEGLGRKFTEEKGEMHLGIALSGNRTLELSYKADRRGGSNRFVLDRIDLIRANGIEENLTKDPLKRDQFKLNESAFEFKIGKNEEPIDLHKIEIPLLLEGKVLDGLLKYTNHFEYLSKKEIQNFLDKKQFLKLDATYRYRATKKFLIKTIVVKAFRSIVMGGIMMSMSSNPIVGIGNHQMHPLVDPQRIEMVLEQAPYLTGELASVSKVEASRLGQEMIQAAKSGNISEKKQSIFSENQTVNMHQLVNFNTVKDVSLSIVKSSESIWIAQGTNQEINFIFVKAGANPINGDIVAVVQLDLQAYPDISNYFQTRYFSGTPTVDVAPAFSGPVY